MENVAVGCDVNLHAWLTGNGTLNLTSQSSSSVRREDTLITKGKNVLGKQRFRPATVFSSAIVPMNLRNKALERMGIIQTHHGSAGSNMVARYMATLHTPSISDFLTAAHMNLDGDRHFGAIHDMTHFINALEQLGPEKREAAIQNEVLGGGIPTFGHPEIAAAGRVDEIQQDPRPAIYIEPILQAIDSGRSHTWR